MLQICQMVFGTNKMRAKNKTLSFRSCLCQLRSDGKGVMVFRAFSFNDTESHFPNMAQKFLTFIQSLFLRWMRGSCCACRRQIVVLCWVRKSGGDCRRQIVAFTLSEEIGTSLSALLATNRNFVLGKEIAGLLKP